MDILVSIHPWFAKDYFRFHVYDCGFDEAFRFSCRSSPDEQMQTRFENYEKHNNRASPQKVAADIIDAIEKPYHPFKTIIGADAVYMLEMRKKLADKQWETESPLLKGLQW